MVAEIALLSGLLVAAYLLVTAIPIRRRVVRLKHEVRVEQTRACWADARSQLMELAREGKLATDSETFTTFYGVQTFVLRRPEAYRDIARALASTMLSKSPGAQNSWLQEVPDWPPEMKEVVGKMKNGTDRLVAMHAGRRFLLGVVLRIAPLAAVYLSRRVYLKLARMVQRIEPLAEDRTLHAAREKMELLQMTGQTDRLQPV